MLLSRRNQLLLEFSFWNEPVPRSGPNIYELRSYQLRVSLVPDILQYIYQLPSIVQKYMFFAAAVVNSLSTFSPLQFLISAGDNDRVGKLLVRHKFINLFLLLFFSCIRKSSNWIHIKSQSNPNPSFIGFYRLQQMNMSQRYFSDYKIYA